MHKYVKTTPSGVLKYRRTFPPDVQRILGKTNFIRSFGSRETSDMNRMYSTVDAEYYQQVNKARSILVIPAEERELAESYLKQRGMLPEGEPYIHLGLVQRLIQGFSKELEHALEHRIELIGKKRSIAEEPLNTKTAEAQIRGVHEVIKQLRLYERMFTEQGFCPSKYVGADTDEVALPIFTHKVSDSLGAGQRMSAGENPSAKDLREQIARSKWCLLSEALEQWKEYTHPKQDTIEHNTKAINDFIALHGDLPLDLITRKKAAEYVEAIRKIPAKARQHKQYRNCSLPELLKHVKAGRLKGEPRSEKTINKVIDAITAAIRVGIRKNVEDVAPLPNVMQGLRLEEKKTLQTRRQPYNTADLEALFYSPMYTGCASSRKRYVGGDKQIRDAYFWLPLIALYTGAREEEIGQLHIEDIKKQGDIWYFEFTAEGDRNLKNEYSATRVVPIHTELIKCGFIDYVERLGKRGENRVFPDLKRGSRGNYTAAFSKWYGRYCDRISTDRDSLDHSRKVFHSFRHTLRSKGAARGLLGEDLDDITGHESGGGKGGSVGRAYYEHRHDEEFLEDYLTQLSHKLERIQFTGLDLSHLHASGDSPKPKPKKKLVLVKKKQLE